MTNIKSKTSDTNENKVKLHEIQIIKLKKNYTLQYESNGKGIN